MTLIHKWSNISQTAQRHLVCGAASSDVPFQAHEFKGAVRGQSYEGWEMHIHMPLWETPMTFVPAGGIR